MITIPLKFRVFVKLSPNDLNEFEVCNGTVFERVTADALAYRYVEEYLNYGYGYVRVEVYDSTGKIKLSEKVGTIERVKKLAVIS